MPSAVSSGTPLRSSVPMVRASRAVSMRATIEPASLRLSSHSSNFARNAGSRSLRKNSEAATAGSATSSHHQSCTTWPSASTIRENSGSSVSRFSYIAENCGTT